MKRQVQSRDQEDHRKLLRFLSASILFALVDFAVFFMLIRIHDEFFLVEAVSASLTCALSFPILHRYVFEPRRKQGASILAYAAVSIVPTVIGAMMVGHALHGALEGEFVLVKTCVLLSKLGITFFLYRWALEGILFNIGQSSSREIPESLEARAKDGQKSTSAPRTHLKPSNHASV